MELYTLLKEKELEQKAWEMYLVGLPYMDKDTFITFEAFLENLKGEQQPAKQEPGYYVNQVMIF